ncbi:hypothetical protein IB254_27200 [Pseudomonas sp. PDM03]|uniref:hypothetical protein n=1 Tax=Pseudomonas TaxID=286 RepID=UPI00177C2646|nr:MULTISPECIES: hypothetical protein [Pseudomonas]MBD9590776.1 hypothetical protein [Pseudomonas sp. PDM03]MCP1516562.1 hypothetical protein [Pseudomonas migulae]
MRKRLGLIGGVVTAVYLLGLAALVWGRTYTLMIMPLNEVGDFLAGAFGPVAFLWLILGFLQQGDELRQGTEALKLQAEELRNSVEQQSIMASAATQQINAQQQALQLQLEETERTFRANFVFGGGPSVSSNRGLGFYAETSIEIGVARSVAYAVEIAIDPPFGGVSEGKFAIIDLNRSVSIPVKFLTLPETSGTVSILYDGADGKRREENFVYTTFNGHPWVKIKRAV